MSAECWLAAGGPHHTVLSTAVTIDMLTTFAAMTRTELALIDRDTTQRRFHDELRWNHVYYKLAVP